MYSTISVQSKQDNLINILILRIDNTNVHYILGLMPPSNSQEYDVHLANAIHGLTSLKKELTAGIMITVKPVMYGYWKFH